MSVTDIAVLEKRFAQYQLDAEKTAQAAKEATDIANKAIDKADKAELIAEQAKKKMKKAKKELKQARALQVAHKNAAKKFAVKRAKKQSKQAKKSGAPKALVASAKLNGAASPSAA